MAANTNSHLRAWLAASTISSMTVAPSLLTTDLAADRRDDLERRSATHRLVRPDARPRRARPPRPGPAGAALAPPL
jgi:hypothetical protein